MLPKKSRIYREGDGSITIRNRSISMNFKVISEGFGSAAVSRRFEKYYMHLEDSTRRDVGHNAVDIIVSIKTNPALIVKRNSIEYNQWAESFLEYLYSKVDFEKFLNEINWRTAETILEVYPKKSHTTHNAETAKKPTKK